METIETALQVNFTSGEGWDLVPVFFNSDFEVRIAYALNPNSKGGYPDTRSVFF